MEDMYKINIPPEALEAAARAIAAEMRVVTEIDVRAFELTPEERAALAGAACLAMLNAWPKAERIYRSADEKLFTIILSLPTENPDDKA